MVLSVLDDCRDIERYMLYVLIPVMCDHVSERQLFKIINFIKCKEECGDNAEDYCSEKANERRT